MSQIGSRVQYMFQTRIFQSSDDWPTILVQGHCTSFIKRLSRVISMKQTGPIKDYMVGTRICMLAMILTLEITGFFFYKSTLHTGLRKKNALDKWCWMDRLIDWAPKEKGPNFCQQVLYILVWCNSVHSMCLM